MRNLRIHGMIIVIYNSRKQKRRKKMKTKEIIISETEKVLMDSEGRWTHIDTQWDTNEGILEADVIDLLECQIINLNKPELRNEIKKHFPMHGFHN